jgi:hypothetical protein
VIYLILYLVHKHGHDVIVLYELEMSTLVHGVEIIRMLHDDRICVCNDNCEIIMIKKLIIIMQKKLYELLIQELIIYGEKCIRGIMLGELVEHDSIFQLTQNGKN